MRRDPLGFARIQWDTWSQPGWFDDAEFAATAESFTNPDWVPITLNAYRGRFPAGAAHDPRYHPLEGGSARSGSCPVRRLWCRAALISAMNRSHRRDWTASSPAATPACSSMALVISRIAKVRRK